ncbi:hypothetical protein R6Z07F_004154 [Ovis aries]
MSGLPWLCHVRKQVVLGEPLHPVSGPHTSTDVCPSKTGPPEYKTTVLQGPKTEPQTSGIPDPGPTLYPSLLLSHFLTLKMSVLEENPGMKMDCEDWERYEPQCSSEDPDRDALEPGPSLTSVSSAHAEIFFVLASRVMSAHENKGSPILLAVSKGELCLYCDKNKGHNKPSLQLKYSPGKAGLAWAVQLEPDPGSVGQRLMPPGSEPAKVAALPAPGELAEEQRLLQELHLALDRALRRPLVLVEHWAAVCNNSSHCEEKPEDYCYRTASDCYN